MPRCLIADDSKTMRMLLIKIMENFGYTVEEAENEIINVFSDGHRQ